MPTKPHTLMSSKATRDHLAHLFSTATPAIRTKIARALFASESSIQADPYSCSAALYDLSTQRMQARIAFFLPLTICFAVDDEKGEVYLHKIDLVSECES